MRTEHLQAYALQWLKDRPRLAEEQLENPVFALKRMVDEVNELLEAIERGDVADILDEWTDVANFFASAEAVIEEQYGITHEQVATHSRYKYLIRNTLKYPAKGYENGTPAKEQLRADTNQWYFWQAYLGCAEIGAGNEYY